MRALQAIRASVDDSEPIHVILDNLNHHRGRDIREWCEANRVELVFTPTYASWANPIEAHFGPLRQFVIANSDHRNHPALARAIRNYVRWRNAHTRDPDVLAAQRRHAARLRSEKQRRWGHPRTTAAERANVGGRSTRSFAEQHNTRPRGVTMRKSRSARHSPFEAEPSRDRGDGPASLSSRR